MSGNDSNQEVSAILFKNRFISMSRTHPDQIKSCMFCEEAGLMWIDCPKKASNPTKEIRIPAVPLIEGHANARDLRPTSACVAHGTVEFESIQQPLLNTNRGSKISDVVNVNTDEAPAMEMDTDSQIFCHQEVERVRRRKKTVVVTNDNEYQLK